MVGREARRSRPNDLDVPLFAPCLVPPHGIFTAFVSARPGRTQHPVLFTLDIRRLEADWTRLHELRVAPDFNWHPFKAPLTGYEGERVELRLTALGSEAGIDENRSPAETACLWADPLVISSGPRQKRPTVLLITLDTTRADRVGDPRHTPCIARLGKQGVVFENAWTNCNSTTPSHASIFTGKYIAEHGVINNLMHLTPDNVLLSERFRDAHYFTAAAVSVHHLQADAGFDQGFDIFNHSDSKNARDGENTVKYVVRWLDEWKDLKLEPFFLWLHLFDPHGPYKPPDDFIASYADRLGQDVPVKNSEQRTIPVLDDDYSGHHNWLAGISSKDHVDFLYDAGVAYADFLVEKTLAAFEKNGFLDNTVVIITADHGESLGEQDVWYAHTGLHESTLKVPLIMKIPGGPTGLRISDPACTLDIVPTLISHCGLEPIPGMRGENLLDLARGKGNPGRRLWFEHGNLKQIGTRDDKHQFITTIGDPCVIGLAKDPENDLFNFSQARTIPLHSSFLFDIKTDPAMKNNLADKDPNTVKAFQKLTKEWHKSLSCKSGMNRDLSEEQKERLRQLGYVGY